MKINKVDFYEYVLLPGQANGRALTIFAKDVDQIELLPNGVRITKGPKGIFVFDKNVKCVEYDMQVAPKPIATEKGKPAKLEVALTNE